jgi:hypothetical protein
MMKPLTRLLSAALLLSAPLAADARGLHAYGILANVDDSKLVLMDQYGGKVVVSAKTFCMDIYGFDEEDIVFSTENLLACGSATLISKRTHQTCAVWCW